MCVCPCSEEGAEQELQRIKERTVREEEMRKDVSNNTPATHTLPVEYTELKLLSTCS